MIDTKRVLAIIPARGGSKGVPRKNVKLLGGKPLIGWTIEAAKGSRYIGRIVISTDDEDVASVAKTAGCDLPFMRPAKLATDTASSVDVVAHTLEALEGTYDWLALLQPTSPFRTGQHIDRAFELLQKYQRSSCVGVVKSNKSPEWMFWLDNRGHSMSPVLDSAPPSRRQDCQAAYVINGAIYICSVEAFKKNKKLVLPDTVPYVMDDDDSLDIDTLEDFYRAEFKIGGFNARA